MRKLYGADAAIHPAMRADNLMDQGDIEGFDMWKRVAAALNELERVKLTVGDINFEFESLSVANFPQIPKQADAVLTMKRSRKTGAVKVLLEP